MSKRSSAAGSTSPRPRGGKASATSTGGRGRRVALVLLVVAAGAAAVAWWKSAQRPATERYQPRPRGTLTFNKDIAPIVFAHCATCHRPGQSGPFDLLTFAEVKKRAAQIAEVTQRRYMPPWLPEAGHGEFVGERRLSVQQIGMMQQWAAEDTPEGAAADLPALPQWSGDWQLGPPDLVVQMPQTYTLRPDGRDVYRNFVLPIPLTERRYVRAVEFRPQSKAAHHAFMLIDRSRQSRRLDEQDAEPGFDGMSLPSGAQSPAGLFASWQPGKAAPKDTAGLEWTLEKESDLVVQMHLQPTGKPEAIQPAVGFYFTDRPPTNTLLKLDLRSYAIDIPAGATDYAISDSYVLPVDAEVLAVLPHAHYLGKRLEGFATLPDGTKKWLLLIQQWDFNWQGDYRLARPMALPKGTTLTMQYTYDNSTNNARNPHHPPRRVQYGPETTDEMGELWIQLQLRGPADLAVMEKDSQPRHLKGIVQYNEYRLRLNPNDATAHNRLGEGLLYLGRKDEAFGHFQAAARLNPDYDEPHYNLGLLLRSVNRLAEAQREFEATLRLVPDHARASGNLGLVCIAQGDLERAELHLRRALQLNPEDTLAREALREVLANKNKGGRGR